MIINLLNKNHSLVKEIFTFFSSQNQAMPMQAKGQVAGMDS